MLRWGILSDNSDTQEDHTDAIEYSPLSVCNEKIRENIISK